MQHISNTNPISSLNRHTRYKIPVYRGRVNAVAKESKVPHEPFPITFCRGRIPDAFIVLYDIKQG